MSPTLTRTKSDRRPGSATLRSLHTVAVSATSDPKFGSVHRVRLNTSYVTALESAGLVPLIVPPLSDVSAARSVIAAADGLVLTGGEDVDPALYGQLPHERLSTVNRRRDETEIALVLAAREARKPVLAICRGPQLLNVALGGTLIQDIEACVPGALPHDAEGVHDVRDVRAHDVTIEPGSRVAAAVGDTRITVNSLHHQSILDPAPGLRVTARAPDGIIEAVESEDNDWWVVAVQWHPEEMTDSPEPWDRGIFRAFAARLEEG
ncbi:MAG TPA: gamma-glutamyl-gamma-aminobutyrate hydrolase family protein [Gemmatimonadaceae bacterium]